MKSKSELDPNGTAFGIPPVLTGSEADRILRHLKELWTLSYGREISELDADLDLCKMFFDPTVRGHKLRERLAELPDLPERIWRLGTSLGPPLVLTAGARRLLVGVEARIAIQLLNQHRDDLDHVILSVDELREAENRALVTYRTWSLKRFRDVVALSTGEGREVLQAISVGIVLALLVNRSTTRSRAIVRSRENGPALEQVNLALFRSADAFASTITPRANRSSGELTLRGGYALTEARRRLADVLMQTPAADDSGTLLYIREGSEEDVVDFLARDLARRTALVDATLALGFDRLTETFREEAGHLANRSMIFERASDTLNLRRSLLASFGAARGRGPNQ